MMTTFMSVLILFFLVISIKANFPGPHVVNFCECMKVGQAFHVFGLSKMTQPDFVIQLLNNANGFTVKQWDQRETYETPFHMHSWFKHPSVPSLNHHYEFALGAGMARKPWDRVQTVKLPLKRRQKYHYVIRKTGNGFDVHLNDKKIIHFA